MKAKERADKAARMLQEWRDRQDGDNAATYFTGVIVRQYHNAGDESLAMQETFISGKDRAYIKEALRQQDLYPEQIRVFPVYALIDDY